VLIKYPILEKSAPDSQFDSNTIAIIHIHKLISRPATAIPVIKQFTYRREIETRVIHRAVAIA